ncbi:Gamma-aminobutyric acid receptor subunit alpha-4 [Desmophyllum pertusum]|uniref:Gamma-aminobutyric acid receptor subunit alpha-4 n=1 Tax=Desmophyllum pertusum TaxID=174260 RepID=A0A9W9YDI5_9CNID|nr:Gamma-aminobutyric acid receptor subunit alpha-4 [Desmophyllum pertusum]
MDKDDMGERTALGITSILTIMFLLGSFNDTLPEVSYPKALDWYLLASFISVFLSVLESSIVFLFASSAKKYEEQIEYKSCKTTKDDTEAPSDDNDDNDLEMVCRATKAHKTAVDDKSLHSTRSVKHKRMEKIADNIDRASQVLFPLAFTVFNMWYWIYYVSNW